jgi:hypothetical protein
MVSERKIRLFRVASCTRFWRYLTIKEARDAVKIAEEFVEGLATAEQLSAAYYQGFGRFAAYIRNRRNWKSRREPELGDRIDWAGYAIDTCAPAADIVDLASAETRPFLKQVPPSLLRDIIGNPFRSITLNPSWLTSTVLALATGIYEEKAFDRMPILADALQDAGCEHEEILNHCRQLGDHVRGCWVVDLLLNKQ